MHSIESVGLGEKVWRYLESELSDGLSTSSALSAATAYLKKYLAAPSSSGNGEWPAIGRRFDQLAMPDESPNALTASDLVAVSFLSVNVPPRAAWAFLDWRSEAITRVLERIPVNLSIEDQHCAFDVYSRSSALQDLWNLLRHDELGQPWGMGPTTVSKLMARKRPRLVPLQDRVVMSELGAVNATYWDLWWHAMHLKIDEQYPVVEFAQCARANVPAAHDLSLLRVLDIIIWMNGKHRVRASSSLTS